MAEYRVDKGEISINVNSMGAELNFDAPLFGIWSPPKKKAPFNCIEPWYGRCDGETFRDELEKREWGNSLEAGETFETKYTIAI